ncbi:response regulator [Puniceibacterium sediminis]|uniref:Response regulator receiver domain-containing protein n=1 Tax=Puniceibacterium sediminis TaxID=1608407 RepID=A0A238Z8E0_9RHOB|nr:response regulator [Puniceibacterium sediminis]SNR79382.1 Response regulator receiver domain-containing protein [Puniceibacterium sediminis]
MDDLEQFDRMCIPTASRPLLGLTLLVVEDSRYACDAIRLMCLRSGARIRRADCLQSARRHLQVYRPSVIIIDMGLPDGSGADLIAELSVAVPRVAMIIATSGDGFAESVAIAAGADDFVEKPMANLTVFQNMILNHMPQDRRPKGVRQVQAELVHPDPIAFRDDMAHAADILSGDVDGESLEYVGRFLSGVARIAGDATLSVAAQELVRSRGDGSSVGASLARVTGLVHDRLADRMAI